MTKRNKMPISTSLLDDFDIGEVDELLKLRIGSPTILVPDQTTKNNLNPRTQTSSLEMNNVPGISPSNSIDDKDWNW